MSIARLAFAAGFCASVLATIHTSALAQQPPAATPPYRQTCAPAPDAACPEPINLRGVKLGDSCSHAIEVERSLNSHPAGALEAMLHSGVLGFDAVSAQREPERVIYRCGQHGRIEQYLLRSICSGRSHAFETYAALKAQFIRDFGPPDSDSDSYDERAAAGLARIAVAATARWRTLAHESLTISLLRPLAGDEWPMEVAVAPLVNRKKS